MKLKKNFKSKDHVIKYFEKSNRGYYLDFNNDVAEVVTLNKRTKQITQTKFSIVEDSKNDFHLVETCSLKIPNKNNKYLVR